MINFAVASSVIKHTIHGDGDITDDDGYGKYASEKAVSNIEIYPSDILANKVRTDFSHIAWYNK